MSESQRQIAREAAGLLYDEASKCLRTCDGNLRALYESRFERIILSAIERAREAEIKMFLPMVKAEIAAAQPQRSEQQEQDLRQLAVDLCQLVHNSSTNAQAADWIYARLNAARRNMN